MFREDAAQVEWDVYRLMLETSVADVSLTSCEIHQQSFKYDNEESLGITRLVEESELTPHNVVLSIRDPMTLKKSESQLMVMFSDGAESKGQVKKQELPLAARRKGTVLEGFGAQPNIHGFLHTLARPKVVALPKRKDNAWKQRWCVVREGWLLLYDTPNLAGDRLYHPKGVHHLVGCDVAPLRHEDTGRLHCFRVQGADLVDLVLSADSRDQVREWTGVIRVASYVSAKSCLHLERAVEDLSKQCNEVQQQGVYHLGPLRTSLLQDLQRERELIEENDRLRREIAELEARVHHQQ